MEARARFAPLTRADFAVVASLADRIWRQHYASIVGLAQVEYMLAGRYTDDNLARYLDADDRWMWLVYAADGDAPVGYLSCARVAGVPDEMKLEQLYLLAEARGGGLGGLMLDAVERHARAHGCTRVMLTVNKGNTGSIAVYEKRGFTVRESAVFDIGGGYVMDDFVMEKRLGA
jgi:ribosomal protein S18 acetylase RimI-like enzyme